MNSANEQNWKFYVSVKPPVVLSCGRGGPGSRWECTCCGKLLGTIDGGRLHLKIARGREYLAGFPATCACPRCGTLNEYTGNPEGMKRVTHN